MKAAEQKSPRTEMKNSLEGLNNRFELAESRISDLEDRTEIIPSEEQKLKMNRDAETCWNTIKYTNTDIMGIPCDKRERDRKHI